MGVVNSLPSIIARQIATDIFNEKLVAGQQIIEDRYAEDFGTSRAPVREALYLLAIEGLIERVPRRGAYVKRYNKQDIKDLYEIRLALELIAVNRIQPPIEERQIARMDQIIASMETAISEGSHEKYTQLNSEYHIQLIGLSNSEVLNNLYSRLGSPLMALQKLSFIKLKDIEHSLADHRILWSLLLTGKKSTAEAVLKEHNQEALERISLYLDKH
jgi:DNA-binding GntR family transcriptional regulator